MLPNRILARRAALSLVTAASVIAVGCKKGETSADTAAPSAVTAAPETAKASAAPTVTDAQIAHIVVTADAIDSAAGELARTKAASQAVKDFGQTMVTDHGGVNTQAVALATKLGVTPEDNDVSRQLKAGADANTAKLQGLSGTAFDKAYIDNEVAYHQSVADAIDKTLIPNAQNAELKALLEKARPAFAAHLERAKSIQASLAK